ncbi:hypothetical protein Y032_0379g324 [Ancylostoma ceylanicum]|uniref:Uncharacterized protein n=1 Tax=Ancylostoma ceylanicum TaxID=53326 RepID=A0A016RUE6_9BILA|nr:hypothetical protein Y032_0379g324 [Ancylostoma ceylanicum]
MRLASWDPNRTIPKQYVVGRRNKRIDGFVEFKEVKEKLNSSKASTTTILEKALTSGPTYRRTLADMWYVMAVFTQQG